MMHNFYPVRFVKSAPNQPISWMMWGLKGMYPDMQLKTQARLSITTHLQAKYNVPAPIISSMDRGIIHDVSFLSCAFLLNLPKTSPSAWHCGARKGCILTSRSCPKLVNPLPHIQKENGTSQQQSLASWLEAHTTMCHFYPVRFC